MLFNRFMSLNLQPSPFLEMGRLGAWPRQTPVFLENLIHKLKESNCDEHTKKPFFVPAGSFFLPDCLYARHLFRN